MNNHRTRVAFAAAFAAVLGCAPPTGAQTREETSLALPALTAFFSSTYVAADAGMWTKLGLDVKLTQITGMGAMNAVLSSSVDFSNSSGPSIIRSNVRGQKLLAIGSTLDALPFELVVRKDVADAAGLTLKTPIEKRVAALKGKKISVDSPNTIVHGYLRYLMRKGGLNPERDITVANMQPPEALAGLKSSELAGSVLSTPYSASAARQGFGKIVVSSLSGDFPEMVPFTFNVIPARPEFCNQKPSVCRKLMDGYLEAMNYIQDKPKESLAILQKRMAGLNPDDLASAFEHVRKWTPRTTKVLIAGLQHSQELMLAGGMIKEDEKLSSFDAIYTNKFTK
jgi:ABC-type nitrate/sulfonate/bicarbonate transport system substrate-binding protein